MGGSGGGRCVFRVGRRLIDGHDACRTCILHTVGIQPLASSQQPPALPIDLPEGVARADGHHALALLVGLHVVQQRVQHIEPAVVLTQTAGRQREQRL